MKKIYRKLLFFGTVILPVIFSVACSSSDNQIKTYLDETTISTNASSNQSIYPQNVDQSSYVEASAETITETAPTTEGMCWVHISGAVNQPGVYELENGSRLYEAVVLAGGFREDASEDYCNLAMVLEDGKQYRIPTIQEAEALEKAGVTSEDGMSGTTSQETASAFTADGRLDLNLATKEDLMTLSGIGESRAEAILAYREEHGAFTCIDELMNVTGIKEGLFQDICEDIVVQ